MPNNTTEGKKKIYIYTYIQLLATQLVPKLLSGQDRERKWIHILL